MTAASTPAAGKGKLSDPPRLVWVVGDRLLAEEKWRALVRDGEVIRLDGKRLDIPALANEIDTLPMFIDHKWILVQDFRVPEKRAAGERSAGKAKGQAEKDPDRLLLTALERVGESCSVILVSDLGDRRTRIARLVQERGQYIELPSFREYETAKMAEWVTSRLHSRSKKISPPLALEFVECVGSEIGQLASEADKLCLAMGEDTVVTSSHMEVLAGSPVALLRLIDEGIIRRQPARAEALLMQTLASNEAPLKILNFMIPRIRDLLKARLFPEGRRDSHQAAAVFTTMHPFRLKTLYEEADRFSTAELREAIHSLVLADTCLKSSVDPVHVLSLLIAALTGQITHASFALAVASYVEPWD